MEKKMVLEFLWYCVICASVVFFTILDGFDLGVGMLHPFAKTDRDRRIFLNAIGPVWDGNEVWLIIIGGALFAGFPLAYATLCSAFYTPIMILLAGIIFRAVAIEFRSKMESLSWRFFWDGVFSFGSYVIAFVIGVLLANLVQGIPLDGETNFTGTFLGFFSPYSILLGCTSIALFMMHGSIYLLMKTEGELHDRLRGWVMNTMIGFMIFYFLLTMSTLIYNHYMADRMREYPFLIVIAVVALLLIANIPRQIYKGNDGWAFLSSCGSITLLFGLFGLGYFPHLILSSTNPDYSITLFNSASSELTLTVILTIACIGVPIVLLYGYYIYRVFRGKVRLDDHSY
ncbi:MAG: cytochrome d ubiquinol oxidase subunit II [Simkaniaceae bacterium]|nr:cytochrome d ubiquinol oxidase subunit II [Simkaniaceae bacterium]